MSIEINNESGVAVDEAALVRLSAFALDFLHVHPDADLAIVLVDEARVLVGAYPIALERL